MVSPFSETAHPSSPDCSRKCGNSTARTEFSIVALISKSCGPARNPRITVAYVSAHAVVVGDLRAVVVAVRVLGSGVR